jgi:preprotein translocase subunit Sss1
MDPTAFRAAFRVAVLILVVALAMLPFQPPTSAEFVVTVLAAVVGLIFVGLVAMLARLSRSRPPNRRPVDTVSGMSSNVPRERSGRD